MKKLKNYFKNLEQRYFEWCRRMGYKTGRKVGMVIGKMMLEYSNNNKK
jgi:tetrahydromethanopterin S-methyltransferase subunit G